MIGGVGVLGAGGAVPQAVKRANSAIQKYLCEGGFRGIESFS